MCVSRGRVARGIAALGTAKEETPCQEMHHYVRAQVQSPHNGDLPGNQTKVLRSLHLSACICNTSFYLSSSSFYLPTFWALRRQASVNKLNCHLTVGLLSGFNTAGQRGRSYSEHSGTCPRLAVGMVWFHMPFLLQYPKDHPVDREFYLSGLVSVLFSI